MQVHGTTYHIAGRLFPDEPANAHYGQVYLYDHGEATKHHSAKNPVLNDKVLGELQDIMDALTESTYDK